MGEYQVCRRVLEGVYPSSEKRLVNSLRTAFFFLRERMAS